MSYELEKLVFSWYIEWIRTGVEVEQEGWTLDFQWKESEYPNESFTHVGSLIARKDRILRSLRERSALSAPSGASNQQGTAYGLLLRERSALRASSEASNPSDASQSVKVKMITAGFKDEPRIVSVRTTR